jgi:hypothetical protein
MNVPSGLDAWGERKRLWRETETDFHDAPHLSPGSRVVNRMPVFRSDVLLVLALASCLAAQTTESSPASSPESALSQTQSNRGFPELREGALSQEQMRNLMRIVAEKDLENEKRSRDYTYIQREEEHKLDGNGRVKSTESKTYEVLRIYGTEAQRLTAKNDQPLSPKDADKEDQKIQKLIDKRKNESEEDRRKRLAKEEKEQEDGRKFVLEIADAYNFRMAGIDQLEGRDTYVIDAEPRPGYEPHMKEAKFLPKFRFRVWIDKANSQWVKLDATCIDTVSFGLFLARLHKGSKLLIETTRVNNEVWLPKHVNVKVDAKLALLKNVDVEEDIRYRDYKKFRTDAKIVGFGELPAEKLRTTGPQ